MFTKTLSANAQQALAILGKSKNLPLNTYMAGGSALALHFGHRLSVDFDFFTTSSFNQETLAKSLDKIGTFEITDREKDTLLGVFNGIKFSIFKYSYPLLFKTIKCFAIELADPKEIGAMKIAALMDRGTKKDFIDLYFLIKHEIFIEDCLNFYDKKYGALANNIYSIILSLSYFEGTKGSEMPVMLENVSWPDVKTFFETESVRLAKKYL